MRMSTSLFELSPQYGADATSTRQLGGAAIEGSRSGGVTILIAGTNDLIASYDLIASASKA